MRPIWKKHHVSRSPPTPHPEGNVETALNCSTGIHALQLSLSLATMHVASTPAQYHYKMGLLVMTCQS